MKHEIEHRTQRRTKAEIELAGKISTLAATKKPDPHKAAKAKRLSEAAKKSPRFEYNRGFSAVDQLPIYYFHRRGESLTGTLGEPDQEMWRGSTYPLLLDDGRVIRLPGNRMLHKAIQAGDYVGQKVTITYDGKLYYRYGGHYQKTYTITSLDLEQQEQKSLAPVASHVEKVDPKQLNPAGQAFLEKVKMRRRKKEGATK